MKPISTLRNLFYPQQCQRYIFIIHNIFSSLFPSRYFKHTRYIGGLKINRGNWDQYEDVYTCPRWNSKISDGNDKQVNAETPSANQISIQLNMVVS